MENLISTFLEISPLKNGIYSLIDYIFILNRSNKARIYTTLISSLIDILYLFLYIFIYFYINKNNLVDAFKHDRTTTLSTTLISFFLLLFVIITYRLFDNDQIVDEIPEQQYELIKNLSGITQETLYEIEIIIGIIFVAYATYDVLHSSSNIYNGKYEIAVDKTDVYIKSGFLLLLLSTKMVRLYLLSKNNKI